MENTTQFKKTLHTFYKTNRRSLPWRETIDPYRVFVSEIMLQQTQVSRVLPKYELFIEHFPTFESLANASFSDILFYWKGLGYNRRAKWLQESARIIVQKYKGKTPDKQNLLEQLPGIGEATAASIIVFTYNIPILFIETNVRRVFIHHFFSNRDNVHDDEVLPYLQETLDKNAPREFYYALMDYGSYLPRHYGNANKKSKHYGKQSKFEGSIRQMRGKILEILITQKTVSMLKLKSYVKDDSRLEQALKGLIDDGLVLQKGEAFSLSK